MLDVLQDDPNVCLCLFAKGCDHLIDCLGFEASLPPHSQRGTSLCVPWPSPPSTLPHQHSTLGREIGKEQHVREKRQLTRTHTHRHQCEMTAHNKTTTLYRQKRNNVDAHTVMQTSYILTKTYIPGDTLDSLTNTHIFIPADIEYKHI